MANEALIQAVKEIVARAKSGDLDGAYAGYRALFESADFAGYRAEEQRQALRLMVTLKGAPKPPTEAMLGAHRAAAASLGTLVAAHREAGDHELLGICHVVTGDTEQASSVFRAGLAIERERNADSDLCGALLKRISEI